jgi:hypothetical protein
MKTNYHMKYSIVTYETMHVINLTCTFSQLRKISFAEVV